MSITYVVYEGKCICKHLNKIIESFEEEDNVPSDKHIKCKSCGRALILPVSKVNKY